MFSTLLRFFLLLGLLILGHLSVHAQSGPSAEPIKRSVTGFGDPEPMDPRYAAASDVAQLKEQVQNLIQAYDQLVTRYNVQTKRLQQLEQQPASAPFSSASRNRALRENALKGSY